VTCDTVWSTVAAASETVCVDAGRGDVGAGAGAAVPLELVAGSDVGGWWEEARGPIPAAPTRRATARRDVKRET
jgi:hypothetical protein